MEQAEGRRRRGRDDLAGFRTRLLRKSGGGRAVVRPAEHRLHKLTASTRPDLARLLPNPGDHAYVSLSASLAPHSPSPEILMSAPAPTAAPLSFEEALRSAGAWPFEEARKLLARIETSGQTSVLFETGYGPSGLPHIGTFGEVARTTMVRNAFTTLTKGAVATRLLAFSDDLDGLRKVPDNVPNGDALALHLGKPLTQVPDPFGSEHGSFGAANNARLRAFLDRFGFDYEFASATDYYKSGRFDAMLNRMLGVYDEVMAIILPTLGPERRATYSPFLPISPRTGQVLQVPILARDVARGAITYRDPDTDEEVETLVTGGRVKCQWKADWALRWAALGVDYEMAGKDLIESVRLSSQIARVLGVIRPRASITSFSSTRRARKSRSQRATGSPSTNGWATPAPRASPCSCSRSRARPSACIST